jgi:FMN-dependent NADH-azoreductase
MSNVLLVLSSPQIGTSISSQYATDLATKITAKTTGKLTIRDLATSPLPHIDAELISGTRSGKTELTVGEQNSLNRALGIVDEVKNADIIVIGAALMNFGPPTNLKSWIDHLAVPKHTFQYGANGPEGLVKGKKVYVVTASAGIYDNGPGDYLSPWISFALSFMGMSDIEFIKLEGLAYGDEMVAKVTSQANEKIAAITA